MASRVINTLNRVVAQQMSAADVGNGNFIGVAIAQNDPGAKIYGVTFGLHVLPEPPLADLGAWCVILTDVIPDPAFSIYSQLVLTASGVPNHEIPGSPVYQRSTKGYPLDRSDEFNQPIPIAAGRRFSAIVGIYTLSGLGGLTLTPYLSVRGEFESAAGRTPRPRPV